MRDILIDADAFICAYSLGLLELIAPKQTGALNLVATEYVARHELSTLAGEVGELEKAGILRIEKITARSEGYQRFNKLRKEHRLDKGEAEAIAWAMGLPRQERPVFISNDRRARNGAKEHGVPTGDVMDFAMQMIEHGPGKLEAVRDRLGPWDDRKQERCRPGDYDGFDSTYQRRRRRSNWPA